MDNSLLILFATASAILLLMWSLRKAFIKFFSKEQKISFAGDLVLGIVIIFLPSFLSKNFLDNNLFVSVVIFGLTYELYGFLLYKIEKVDSIGVLSYFRKKITA